MRPCRTCRREGDDIEGVVDGAGKRLVDEHGQSSLDERSDALEMYTTVTRFDADLIDSVDEVLGLIDKLDAVRLQLSGMFRHALQRDVRGTGPTGDNARTLDPLLDRTVHVVPPLREGHHVRCPELDYSDANHVRLQTLRMEPTT